MTIYDMTLLLNYTIGFFLIAIIGLYTYSILSDRHAKRFYVRKAVYRDLYGSGMLTVLFCSSLLLLFFLLKDFSDLLGALIIIPVFLIQGIWIAMSIKLIFFKKHVEELPDRLNNHTGKLAIILPTYKEPFQIAKMTFDSLMSLQYDGELMVIVVDNSGSHEEVLKWKNYVESYRRILIDSCSSRSAVWLSRDPSLKGYKPLNLDTAFKEVISQDPFVEYIMYVDADSIFTSDTLARVIPEFKADENLGYIQMMTLANNIGVNELSRAVGIQQTVQRFVLGEFGNWGIPIFYGHNAIFKRTVIDDLDGFLEVDTQGNFILTEDFSASISTYLNGYYGKTHWIYSSEGVPTSLNALKTMWQRWTFGAWQVLFKRFWSVVTSKQINFFEKFSFVVFSLSYLVNALIPLLIILSFFNPVLSYVAVGIPVLISLLHGIGFELNFKGLINDVSGAKRIKVYYQAFFIIPTYIVWITFQTTLKFFSYYFLNNMFLKVKKHFNRLSLEWVVTPKGNENQHSILQLMYIHLDIIAFTLTAVAAFVFFLLTKTNNIMDNLLSILPGLFFVVNMFSAFILFSKQGRNEDEMMLGEIQSQALDAFVKGETLKNKTTSTHVYDSILQEA